MSPQGSEEATGAGRGQQGAPSGGPPRVIAEIGTSHRGDLSRAEELIHAAAEAGAQVAKFQAVFAEEIVHPRAGSIELPGGSVAIFERFRSLEQDEAFYAALQEICLDHGISFLCTPFGLRSAKLLSNLKVREWKVASPELNHLPLLSYLAETSLPVIVSSGVSTLGDIELALRTLRARKEQEITLLHCVTSYPAPPEEYNLRILPHLAALFGVDVGVSDHSLDPELVPGLAVLEGARVIEKHITLSRNDGGLDDPIALEPEAFKKTVSTARSVWQLRRAGAAKESILKEFCESYGESRVEAILGSGRKELAPSEAGNYGTTNRSILATKAIAQGEPIRREDVALLRSEHNIAPGLHPRHLEELLGALAVAPIPSGTGITWSHVIRK